MKTDPQTGLSFCMIITLSSELDVRFENHHISKLQLMQMYFLWWQNQKRQVIMNFVMSVLLSLVPRESPHRLYHILFQPVGGGLVAYYFFPQDERGQFYGSVIKGT